MDNLNGSQHLSRRAFLNMLGLGAAAEVITACTPQAPVLPPNPTATETLQFLATLTPTQRAVLAQALTGTPIPPDTAVPAAGTSLPTEANATATAEVKLAELPATQQAMAELAGALGKAGIQLDAKAQADLANGITEKKMKGKDGAQLDVATVAINLSALGGLAGEYPLLVKTEQGWQMAHPKHFGHIGTFYDSPYYPVPDRDRIFENTIANYNIATIDRLTWHETGGASPDDYSLLDRAINAVRNARKDGMEQIWAMNLLDPLSSFEFTFLGQLQNPTQERMTQLVIDHLRTVVGAVKDEVELICPITESRPGDNFAQVMGEDYLVTVFQTIKDIAPNAKLIYNDGRNYMTPGTTYTHYAEQTAWTKSVVQKLKDKDLIDGVGLQMHLYAHQQLNLADFQKVMSQYQQLGVQVYITEFDVDLTEKPGDQMLQAQMYYDAIKTFLTSPASSRIINLWDGAAGDKLSWYERDGHANAEPTPFSDDLSPKFAYYSMVRAMAEAAR